jgi:transcriptional regulator
MYENKSEAIKLRKQGKTYNEISRIIGIPKSTLASWFKKMPFSREIKERNYSKVQKIWARNITRFNKEQARIAKEKAALIQKEAEKDIDVLSERELLLIGTALYWAEGYKRNRWTLQFSNSDPAMIKIAIKFFERVCKVPKKRNEGQRTNPSQHYFKKSHQILV